jgi:hypothetical protein
MKNYKHNIIVISLIIFTFLNIASAQTFNFQQLPADNSQFGFKFLKPTFVKPRTSSTLSGIYELSANIPLTSELNFIGSIPYKNFDLEANYNTWTDKTKQTGFGNIFIGLQTNSDLISNEISVYSFGIFLPSEKDYRGIRWAALTNYYKIQHFFPNSMALYFNYAYHKIIENSFRFGLEVGSDILTSTKYFSILSSLVHLHYGIATGYQVNKLLMNL